MTNRLFGNPPNPRPHARTDVPAESHVWGALEVIVGIVFLTAVVVLVAIIGGGTSGGAM
jgi:hypothetical protein